MTRARWVGLAGGVAVAVLGALWALTPAQRFVVGSAPSGVDEAILLTRRNDGGSRYWVELVAADGTLRWSEEITPFELVEALGFTGAAAAGDRVLVLTTGEEPHAAVVIALSRADGGRLWEATLPGALPFGGAGRIGPMLIADGERVFVVHEVLAAEDRLEQRIDALSLATGEALWERTTIDGPPFDTRLDVGLIGADRLLLSTLFGPAAEVDRASGAISQRFDGSRLCQLPDSWTGSARRVALNTPCGARDGDSIVALASDEGVALTRIDATSGEAGWRLPLGDRWFDGDATLEGPLPRFLPVVVHGDGARELLIVDLDAGTIAHRAAVTDRIRVLVSSDRAWLWLPSSGVLVATDPATGGMQSAMSFAGAYGVEARAEDVAFGQMWITTSDFARPGDLPWAVVDLATGRLAGANGGMVAKDVTPEVRSALGL